MHSAQRFFALAGSPAQRFHFSGAKIALVYRVALWARTSIDKEAFLLSDKGLVLLKKQKS
jgi:hypothetical protein